MKCDACGHESGFEAAFIKQPRSFGRSPRQVCASCWVHRNNRRHLRFLAGVVTGGLIGFILTRTTPESLLGQILLSLFLLQVFLICSIIPHELGHAIAARLVGWRAYQIVIGVGKPLFKRRWFGTLFELRSVPIGGATWLAPRNVRFLRIKRFITILAGPAVNALMAVGVIVLWQGSLANYDFDALPKGPRLFLLANFFVVLVNLWPFQTKTGFALPTDGKQLLQLISFRKKALDEVRAFQFAIDAMLKRDEGNLSGAQEACEKGLAIVPEDRTLLNMSGIVHLDQQNYVKAREVFLKLLETQKGPSSLRFMLLNNLAYADALSEDATLLSEADFYSQEAIAAMPWASSVVGTRGTVMVAMGRYAEGITLLKRSMDDADKPASKAENACHLAIALARTGANEQAEKYVQLAEQLSPMCPLIDRAKRAMSGSSTNPLAVKA